MGWGRGGQPDEEDQGERGWETARRWCKGCRDIKGQRWHQKTLEKEEAERTLQAGRG